MELPAVQSGVPALALVPALGSALLSDSQYPACLSPQCGWGRAAICLVTLLLRQIKKESLIFSLLSGSLVVNGVVTCKCLTRRIGDRNPFLPMPACLPAISPTHRQAHAGAFLGPQRQEVKHIHWGDHI